MGGPVDSADLEDSDRLATRACIDNTILSITSTPPNNEQVENVEAVAITSTPPNNEQVENVEAVAITATTNNVPQIPEAVPFRELTTDEMLSDPDFLVYIKYTSKEDFYTRMKYVTNKSFVDSVTKLTYEEYLSKLVNNQNQKAAQNE
jgi:hypothetical protein